MSASWGTPGPAGPQGIEGSTGMRGPTGPAGPPELAAEGTATTVDDDDEVVASYTLIDNHRYVLRFKTTAWDGSNNGGYWEHVQVISRIGGVASSTQEAEVEALETEFAGVVLAPGATATGTQMQVIGEVGKTIAWATKIYVESVRAV